MENEMYLIEVDECPNCGEELGRLRPRFCTSFETANITLLDRIKARPGAEFRLVSITTVKEVVAGGKGQ